MQPELLSQLKIEIHNKCVAYDYSDAPDTTLSDFIINLLQAYKTAEEVNEELIALVGSDYDSNLTQWIFERKKELENTPTQNLNQQQQPQQVEQNQQEQKDENMDDVSKITKPNRESRIFSKAIGSVIGNVNRNGNSSQSRRNERSRSRSPKRYSSRSPKRYSSRSPKRYSSRSPARYSSRSPVRQSSRSPVRQASRSPVRHASRYEHDRHSSRHEDRRSNRYDNDRNNSSNIFSRLGHSNTNPEKEDGRPSVFDRLGGSKPITITQNNQDSKKERCKYWPNCKNGEQCIYFHPTTVCPDFPNCSKPTVECMFIHPEIPKPVMPQIKKLPVPCKFFPYCTNPLCPFVHPVAPQPFFMQPNPSFATTGQRVQIPCKNGDQCTRPDCHFLHPKDPNPKTDVICKFDGACTRPNCFYKHTKPTNPNKVFIKPDLNTRQFSVAEDEVVERIPVGDSADLITNQQESTATKTDDDVVMDTN